MLVVTIHCCPQLFMQVHACAIQIHSQALTLARMRTHSRIRTHARAHTHAHTHKHTHTHTHTHTHNKIQITHTAGGLQACRERELRPRIISRTIAKRTQMQSRAGWCMQARAEQANVNMPGALKHRSEQVGDYLPGALERTPEQACA